MCFWYPNLEKWKKNTYIAQNGQLLKYFLLKRILILITDATDIEK